MKKTIHYGKELKKAIKAKKLMKLFIASKLKITRPTLDARLKDGNFTPVQIEIIKELLR